MRAPPVETLAALADSTRLRILSLLSRGPLCVGDLVTLLGLPQPTISRHLAVLRKRGLVHVRTAERWRIYSLPEARDDMARAVLDLVRAAAAEDAGLRRDLEQRAELAVTGGCCPALSAERGATSSEPARGSCSGPVHPGQVTPGQVAPGQAPLESVP